jgi:hypothetical protein
MSTSLCRQFVFCLAQAMPHFQIQGYAIIYGMLWRHHIFGSAPSPWNCLHRPHICTKTRQLLPPPPASDKSLAARPVPAIKYCLSKDFYFSARGTDQGTMNVSGISTSTFNQQYPASGVRNTEKPQDRAAAASPNPAEKTGQSPQQASDDQKLQQEIQRLKTQEEKVKAHEAAHKAAGGQYASSATYTYRPGPDGRSYIVGGEVQIDMSPGRTPQETIAKMQVVQRAAMAPADPSGQDRAVAAQAAAQAAQAQQEQLKQDTAEQSGESSATTGASAAPAGKGAGTAAQGKGAEVTVNQADRAAASATSDPATETRQTGQKEEQIRSSNQLGAYKANTTPGDIFASQKMSTYA